jgi:hypothetical protein
MSDTLNPALIHIGLLKIDRRADRLYFLHYRVLVQAKSITAEEGQYYFEYVCGNGVTIRSHTSPSLEMEVGAASSLPGISVSIRGRDDTRNTITTSIRFNSPEDREAAISRIVTAFRTWAASGYSFKAITSVPDEETFEF